MCIGLANLKKMCIQKIAPDFLQEFIYGCNYCTAKIYNVTHVLNQLISYTNDTCILSNDSNTFEFYIPSINIEKIKESFNCNETVKLDSILSGVTNIVNSFNSNSNNVDNGLAAKKGDIEEKLDRIESEIIKRNYTEYNSYLLILTLCFIIIGIIIYLINSL